MESSTIQNTKFLDNNAALSNTISILKANKTIFITGCTFQNNMAASASKNIFIGFSKVVINYGIFYEDPLLAFSQKNIAVKGSFINMIMDVDLFVNNTDFLNGYSMQGGAIYATGSKSNCC